MNSNEQMANDVIDEKLVAEIATSLISQYLDEIKYYEKPKFKNLFIEDESTAKSDKEEFNKQIDIILNRNRSYILIKAQSCRDKAASFFCKNELFEHH